MLNNSNPATFPVGCGFYGHRTRNSFFFAVFAVQATTDSNIIHSTPPQILWIANRASPVKENASLDFTKVGNLVLKDADSKLIWSSHTSSVDRMQVTGNGTLQLVSEYDYAYMSGNIIWESLDYPTDMASKSSSDTISEIYREILYQGSVIARDSQVGLLHLQLGNNSLVIYESDMEIFQYLRLDSDGHLRAYKWADGIVSLLDELLADNFGQCGYPTFCGDYGICSNGNDCSCPVGKMATRAISGS
ncbi:PAN domain-containing protein At5g03700-like [Ricinus communis]|uniref:PAN domain-containing protein At5g03700-like n=1 Tax=Ricinus communis TaxID=3988 RepID=UPI00201A6669|nr:PAN domain-containing protein At5g03700-like [Ricinus communis]